MKAPRSAPIIGAALQEAALDPLLTGREHLILQATLQSLPRRERPDRANALLTRVGLSEAADRRRLDLALALVHAPQILFLDEPTTAWTHRAAARCGGRAPRP